jgi:hypothetical protein
MAYNLRYFIPYKKFSGIETDIWILEKDTSTGTYQTLTADDNPLEITFDGDVNNIYAGTVGSGATINLRVTPLSMTNLFTTDPQKFKVLIYSNSALIWQGFISTGISYEELNSSQNTLFTLKANDGMAVLDLIPYQLDPSTYYQDNTSAATVLQRIMSKLNLVFDNGWGAMDYRVDDYEQSIFFNLGVNQTNYIDENGKAMSCREVLNTIMTSLGLRVAFRGSAFHVIDPINLHDVTKGQIISTGWDANAQNYPGGFLDISLNQIKWYSTGISKDQTQPYNQIEINYDPYTLTNVSYDLSNVANWSNAGSWSGLLGASGPDQYYINNTIQYKNMVVDGSILQQAIKRADGSGLEYYLKLQKNTHQQTGYAGIARISFPFSNIYNDPNIFLKISADFRCNTLGYDNIYDSSTAPYTVNYIDVSMGYLLGGGPDSSIHWFKAKILTDYTLTAADFTPSEIQDKWVTNTWKYPFGSLGTISKDGSINVYIGGYYTTGWLTTTDKNCLVKNINVDIVNANGETVKNTGQKFTALKSVSDNYINTPTTVQLNAGIGPYGSSRAAYRSPATLAPLDGIYRGLANGSGTKYNTAFHVAQSFVSEYNTPRTILTGNLDVQTHLLDTQNYLIRWSTYFPNKSFFIANAVYNDRDEYMSVQMIECTNTRDNITLT